MSGKWFRVKLPKISHVIRSGLLPTSAFRIWDSSPHTVCVLSCVRLFEAQWTVAHQAPLSMKFSRQEYWSALPRLLCIAGDSLPTEPPGKPLLGMYKNIWTSLKFVWSVAQSCPILCGPMDCNPLGSSAHRIFQARILEWVAIFYSMVSSRPKDQTCVFCLLHWQAGSLPLHHMGSPLHMLALTNFSQPPKGYIFAVFLQSSSLFLTLLMKSFTK